MLSKVSTILVLLSVLTAAHGSCHTCQSNRAMCHDERRFTMCSEGISPDDMFECPSGYICTGEAEICVQASAAIEPTCDESCDLCKSQGKLFACVSETTYAYCFGADVPDYEAMGVCPDGYVCNLNSPEVCTRAADSYASCYSGSSSGPSTLAPTTVSTSEGSTAEGSSSTETMSSEGTTLPTANTATESSEGSTLPTANTGTVSSESTTLPTANTPTDSSGGTTLPTGNTGTGSTGGTTLPTSNTATGSSDATTLPTTNTGTGSSDGTTLPTRNTGTGSSEFTTLPTSNTATESSELPTLPTSNTPMGPSEGTTLTTSNTPIGSTESTTLPTSSEIPTFSPEIPSEAPATESPLTTPPDVPSTTLQPRDAATFCNDQQQTGFYRAEGDRTCREYFYCYLLSGQYFGVKYTCPTSKFFDDVTKKCQNIKPNNC